MRRPLGVAFATVLVTSPLATRSGAIDIHPQDEYVAACTFLGGMGGAALGVSLGGLSRPAGGSRVTPFLRYGSLGMLFGAVLGHEIGANAVEASRAAGDFPPPATREATGCLGALAGELVGFGIGVAVAAPSGPLSLDNREIWAGISLGAVVGAASGFLMRPVRLLVPPPPRSRTQARLRIEQEQIEPLLPLGEEGRNVLRGEEGPRAAAGRVEPAMPPAALERLGNELLQPEGERLAGAMPHLRNEPAPLILPNLEPPPALAAMARSAMTMGLLEGAVLGAAAGGAASGGSGRFASGLAAGGGVGALAGLSAVAALTDPWTDPKRLGQTGVREGFEEGRRTSGVLAGGMVGALIGGAAGAVIYNTTHSFDRGDVSLCALGGNLAGLLTGYLLTERGDVLK